MRSFAAPLEFRPAIPNGTPGSGLTAIVGPNNSGKSALLEAIQAISLQTSISVGRDARNREAHRHVRITATWQDGAQAKLESREKDPNQLVYGSSDVQPPSTATRAAAYVSASRPIQERAAREGVPWSQFYSKCTAAIQRTGPVEDFTKRAGAWAGPEFRELLRRMEDDDVSLTRDAQSLEAATRTAVHGPRDLGRGVLSLVLVADDLYDAPDGATILIDEPEVSLHPRYQKKLLQVLIEFSRRLQIIYATHSNYMINWRAIRAGGKLCRVARGLAGQAQIYELRHETISGLGGFEEDWHNPHLLGLQAREVLFLGDSIILVEGQEDVLMYGRVLQELGLIIDAEFFGFGVGGADKMGKICRLLQDLGFRRVCGILDGNKDELAKKLGTEFESYKFLTIPCDDVRDKPAVGERPAVSGLCTSGGKLKDEHRSAAGLVFADLKSYMSST